MAFLRSPYPPLCLLLACLLAPAPARAQTFVDPAFFFETVASFPAFRPVGMAWLPDGRMLVWQEDGVVRLLKDGVLVPEPFLDFRDRVNTVNDRGFHSLAPHPDFAANGLLYLLYTYEPTGQQGSRGAKTARLTRVRVDPSDPDRVLAASETVILGSIGTAPCSRHPAGADCIGSDEDSHTVGTLRFARDGRLFVSIGDGASYRAVDTLALRAQDLDRYEGKILRIDPDGSAPGDNPFDDGTQSIRSKVYAYGLRNPFRFALDASGEPVIGDVGWGAFEEVNRGKGRNFGWPCYEGGVPQKAYQDRFAACRALPASAVAEPLHAYGRSEGTAVIGGSFNTGTRYPEGYRGHFFYADYTANAIRRLVLNADGSLAAAHAFATDVSGPVTLERGPDGFLYYLAFNVGGTRAELRRLRYADAPVAKASAAPARGRAPLRVAFSSAGTLDPNGLALAYRWDFGDGTSSTEADPVHAYAPEGDAAFTARLTVTNSRGASSRAEVRVTVGGEPPDASVTSPAPGVILHPGDTLAFAGTATDPDQALPDSAFLWTLLLRHDTHLHPLATLRGRGGRWPVEDHGAGEFRYEIRLTVTDSTGLEDTASVTTAPVVPRPRPDLAAQGTLSVTVSPPGARVFLAPSAGHPGRLLGTGSASWSGPAGVRWIEAAAAGHRPVRLAITVPEGGSVSRAVSLRPAAPLLLRAGKPLPTSSALPAGAGPLVFADFDADGRLDLALVDGDRVRFHRGASGTQGPFAPAGTSLPDLDLPGLASLSACDWEGDGDYDLLAGFGDGRVAVILHEGRGFGAPREAARAASGPVHPLAADLDGEGRKDLLVNAGSAGLLAFRNAGPDTAPRFPDPPVPVSLPGEARCDGPVTLEDVDGDGRVELVGLQGGRLRAHPLGGNAFPPVFGEGRDLNLGGAPGRCDGCVAATLRTESGMPGLVLRRPDGSATFHAAGLLGDIDADGKVGPADREALAQAWEARPGTAGWDARANLVIGGAAETVDLLDLGALGDAWGAEE